MRSTIPTSSFPSSLYLLIPSFFRCLLVTFQSRRMCAFVNLFHPTLLSRKPSPRIVISLSARKGRSPFQSVSTLYAVGTYYFVDDALTVHYAADGAPAEGSIAHVVGELFFPPGDSDGHVQASQVTIVADPAIAKQVHLGAASVVALGTLASVIDRDWFLEVAVYERSVSFSDQSHC